MKTHQNLFTLFVGFMLLSASLLFSATPRIWVSKSVVPDTIYYEGAPDSTRATVTLRAWASGDSIFVGNPVDVIFCVDNGPKMQTRLPGARNWISPNRIQGAYNAASNFVDSFVTTDQSRSALIRFSFSGNKTAVDTTYAYTNNPPFAKGELDTNLIGSGSGNATWLGLIKSIQYAAANYRLGTTTAIMVLTTQNDRNSGDEQTAINTVYRLLDSLRAVSKPIRVYIVGTGLGVSWDNNMQQVADSSGGSYAITIEGLGIDSLFQDIGQKLMDIVAIRVDPSTPMIVDVLGPDIHYVPASFRVDSGMTPVFSVDTVNGLTRLNFALDTVRAGRFMQVSYQITAAIPSPDPLIIIPKRVSNYPTDDAVNFSRVYYRTYRDSLTWQGIPKKFVFVKSGVAGLLLSLSANSVVLPSATRIINLPFSMGSPGIYRDTLMHALLTILGTDTVIHKSIHATWNFSPHPNWTAPVLTNYVGSSRTLGVTAPYNYADTRTLTLSFTINGVTFRDSLTFVAYDVSGPEFTTRIYIDADTATRTTPTDRITIIGSRTQLSAYSKLLYARSLSSWDTVRPINALWSSSGFTHFDLSGIMNGYHTQRTLAFVLDTVDTNFAQTDSGFVTIDSLGFTYSTRIVIIDTTDYDTTDRLVFYDNPYTYSPTMIEAAYPAQVSRNTFTLNLSDSLTFWAMLFDINRSGPKYLDTHSIQWSLNGSPVSTASRFGLRSYRALSTDTVTGQWVNEWGVTLRDTAYIRWGFGTGRFLSLEGAPGVPGDTATVPATAIFLDANADTVRGLFAVVRDQYGHCVYSGQGYDYAVWDTAVGAAGAYVDLPSIPTSEGFVHRKASPPATLSFYLRVIGLASGGILGKTDSVLVTLANYAYTRIDIFASSAIGGFNPGDLIPRDALIDLSCGLMGRFETRALHEDSLYDIVTVDWSVTTPAAFPAGAFPINSVNATLAPERYVVSGLLTAAYVSGGQTFRDTLRYRMVQPAVTGLSLDSVRNQLTDLSEIRVTGNLAQLRTRSFQLFANARTACPADPVGFAASDWSSFSLPINAWFDSMATSASACSLLLDLSRMPPTPGSHNFTAVITVGYGALSENIRFVVVDTTDYDTLKYFLADTVRPAPQSFPYGTDAAAFPLLTARAASRITVDMRAGDTLRLYPLLFDLKVPSPGQLWPKLIGNDYAAFQVRRTALGSILDTTALSYAYTSTVAGLSDTLILSYPSFRRNLSDSAYPSRFAGSAAPYNAAQQTWIVRWLPGRETRLSLRNSDDPVSSLPVGGTTLYMPLGMNKDTVYAWIYDQFGNPVSRSVLDVTTWSVTGGTQITVPSEVTHICTLTKTSLPPVTTRFTVTATLPANTYLGDRTSPAFALKDSVFLSVGPFTYNALRIVTRGNALPFVTTSRDTLAPDGDTVAVTDTLLLRACDDTVRLAALLYNQIDSAWEDAQVQWVYHGVSRGSGAVAPRSQPGPDSIGASYTAALRQMAYFRVLPEYPERLELTEPASPRVVLFVNTTAAADPTLSLRSLLTSNCGNTVDSAPLWSISGFAVQAWRDTLASLLSVPQISKSIRFDWVRGTLTNRNDSGTIRIRRFSQVLNDTLRDSVRVVLVDTTDYDTIKAMVLVPEWAYKAADTVRLFQNLLYSRFVNQPLDSLYSGDTVRLMALLFDIKSSGPVFLGAGRTPVSDARVYFTLNDTAYGQPDSLFTLSRTSPRTDTLRSATVNSAGDTLAVSTLLVHWRFGRQRLLRIENQPGVAGVTTPADRDTLYFELTRTADSVYSVVRDEFGNVVSNEPLKWTMTPSNYFIYFTAPNPAAPTAKARLTRTVTAPPATTVFDLWVRLDAGTVIQGVTAAVTQRDTVKVVLANYSFDALNIYADASITPVRDTARTVYLPDQIIPTGAILFLTALSDTVTLKAKARRTDTQEWVSVPVEWTLTNPAPVGSSTFPLRQNVTLVPFEGVTLDTLVASYRINSSTVRRDTVLLTVDIPWIDSVAFFTTDTVITAGDSLRFSLILLDKNGDTVTDASRAPSRIYFETDGPLLYFTEHFSRWIDDTAFTQTNPFENGTARGGFTGTYAGTIRVIVQFAYPAPGGGTALYNDTLFITVRPGPADSMSVINTRKNAVAALDTLADWDASIDRTSVTYRIGLFDRYGNPIPAASATYNLWTWSASGGVLDTAVGFQRLNNTLLEYSTRRGVETGGWGTITIAHPGGGTRLIHTMRILIIPLIRVDSISTHEWVADTLRGVRDIERVLDSVFNVNPNSLWDNYTGTLSRNALYLDRLAGFGLRPFRDGFLDYLTLDLSEPFDLTPGIIGGVFFAAGADTVRWALRDADQGIRLVPADTLPRSSPFHRTWRLWLIPHSKSAAFNASLETGFLPSVEFQNDSIKYRDLTRPLPFIGSGQSVYRSSPDLVRDRAAPVLSRFLMQNNACNPDNPDNTLQLSFSEPIRTSGLPVFSAIRGLTLINAGYEDSLFTAACLTGGTPKDRILPNDSLHAWNYKSEPDRMILYEMIIRPDSNRVFAPSRTMIRFSGDSSLTEFADLSGNRGCGVMNRVVTLSADTRVAAHICAVSGNTVVSRTDAATYTWAPSTDPADQGAPVPLFPYLGFTVNLDITSANAPRNTIVYPAFSSGGRNYIICDFDTSTPFIVTEAVVFDILGNLVASPVSHPSLSVEFTYGIIRRYFEMDQTDREVPSMTLSEIESHYSIHPSGLVGAPDTLRPLYPATVTLGYDFMRKMCGPGVGGDLCVPAWNCLNSKGRLVAPGGYLIEQTIRTSGGATKTSRKIIVKSGVAQAKAL